VNGVGLGRFAFENLPASGEKLLTAKFAKKRIVVLRELGGFSLRALRLKAFAA
jgi:hypothetical protein